MDHIDTEYYNSILHVYKVNSFFQATLADGIICIPVPALHVTLLSRILTDDVCLTQIPASLLAWKALPWRYMGSSQ